MKLKHSSKLAALPLASLDGIVGENGVSFKGLNVQSGLRGGTVDNCGDSFKEKTILGKKERDCQYCYDPKSLSLQKKQCGDWNNK